MVNARELKPVTGRIIDPSEMDDDGGVHTIAGEHLPYDPSKIVTNPSLDPRGSAAGAKDPLPAGPVVVPVAEPLRPARGKVKRVNPEPASGDDELADFVHSLGMDPTDVGLSTPAYTKPTLSTPAYTKPSAAQEPGDALERAYQAAARLLAGLPKGCELFVGGDVGAEAVELAMGLGLLVGKGYAVYRGDGHYRITDAGRTAWAERNTE